MHCVTATICTWINDGNASSSFPSPSFWLCGAVLRLTCRGAAAHSPVVLAGMCSLFADACCYRRRTGLQLQVFWCYFRSAEDEESVMLSEYGARFYTVWLVWLWGGSAVCGRSEVRKQNRNRPAGPETVLLQQVGNTWITWLIIYVFIYTPVCTD